MGPGINAETSDSSCLLITESIFYLTVRIVSSQSERSKMSRYFEPPICIFRDGSVPARHSSSTGSINWRIG